MRVLTITECEKPRTPRELRSWVDRKLRVLSSTRAVRNQVRLRRLRYSKWFMEEIFPLSRFGTIHFRNRTDVTLRPIKGSQKFDAEIASSAVQPFNRIEITHAGQNQEEYFRMLYLEQHGSVPMLGPITAKRDQAGRLVVETVSEAHSHQAVRDRILAMVLERVEAKAKKCYAPDVALLVAFSPLIPPTDEDREAIAEFAQRRLKTIHGEFSDIFLVSTFG